MNKSQTTTSESDGLVLNTKTAMVAGGCFWCVESDLEKLPGVIEAISGYAGGKSENPTYQDYTSGGHREVVEIKYDEDVLSFAELITYALKHMDPTDDHGSFGDRGDSYAPALYYANDNERATIESVLNEIEALGVYKKPLAVDIEARPKFWPAEDYHQNYYQGSSALKYKFYRQASGRDKFIKEHWGEDTGPRLPKNEATANSATSTSTSWQNFQKPNATELKNSLTPLQYKVTQEEGTEPAFTNEYWDNKEPGIYVDVISGEPLFLSIHKYDSGTGWPSFTQPIGPTVVTERIDKKLWQTRTEVRSALAGSHLGHVFTDGPKESTGLRYCLNSAALRFVPLEKMAEGGYGDYLSYFD